MAKRYVATREDFNNMIYRENRRQMSKDDVFLQYSSYGNLFFIVGNMEKAEEYYVKAYRMRYTLLYETKNYGMILESLGLICYRLGLNIPNINRNDYLSEAEKYYSELITKGAQHWQSRLDEVKRALSESNVK